LYYTLPRRLNTRYLFSCRNYVFEVTYACNLNCSMCCYLQEIARKQGEIQKRTELTGNEIRDIVKQLPRKSNIAFTGGEPFVKKGFIDAVREAKQRGFSVTIGTNGVLLTPGLCAALVELRVDQIGLSLDGPREIHNQVRGKPNAFDGLVNGIRTLREARDTAGTRAPRIMVNAVILPKTYELLPETIRIMKEIGADTASIEAMDGSYERSASRLRDTIDPNISPMENVPRISAAPFRECLEKTFDVANGINLPLSVSPRGMTIADLVAYYQGDFNLAAWQCFVPWETCRISPYGDLFPCMNCRIGNVRDQSLYSLWTSPRYAAFRQLFKNGKTRPCCAGCCKLAKRR